MNEHRPTVAESATVALADHDRPVWRCDVDCEGEGGTLQIEWRAWK